jgi:hypothetical protein
VLRTDQEIAAALDIDSDLEDELLSTAGSITDLSRWIGGELQLGKRILRIQSLEKVFSRKKKGKSLINCFIGHGSGSADADPDRDHSPTTNTHNKIDG